MQYTFNKADKGIFGKAFEMAIKDALKRKNADRVSPCGTADFRYDRKNYDTKQNSSVIRYANSKAYIKGSNRVIYASHIACVTAENGDNITVDIDLTDTQMYVVDKKQFVEYLLDNGLARLNRNGTEINIQTGWNYKKNAWHGRVGKRIEEWCYDNEIDDDIIDNILEGAE